MKNLNAILVTAALSGLMCGATVSAQTVHRAGTNGPSVKAAKAGLRYVQDKQPAKHSCKGKNDCKGQGGCKTGDNGCATTTKWRRSIISLTMKRAPPPGVCSRGNVPARGPRFRSTLSAAKPRHSNF